MISLPEIGRGQLIFTHNVFRLYVVLGDKLDWYLTITEKKDIIELPIDNLLDINGWDLRKSLQLMRKSNSPLLEWLSSPIQYQIWHPAFKKLKNLSTMAFLPESSCYHYLSMAKKHIKEIEGSERVKLKKYMYTIRPVLCCEWIIKNKAQPPMKISDLMADILDDTMIEDVVNDYIDTKKGHSEKHTVERSKAFEGYINKKIVWLQTRIPKNPPKPELDVFDEVFRSIICGFSHLYNA